MKNNRTDFLSGCICIYSISVLICYTAFVFFIGKRMDDFCISHLIYVFVGALCLYAFDYMAWGRLKRRTILFFYILISILFAAGTFLCFSLTKEVGIGLAVICVCLSYCGKLLNDKPLEKVSAITRFELTTILLLLLMVTLELKPDLEVNMIPIVAAVVISLAEVSRISFHKKNEACETLPAPLQAAVFGLYMAALGCTVILIAEKSWIVAGMSFVAEVLKQAGRTIGSLVTGFFGYVAAHLTGKTTGSLIGEEAGQAYMKANDNPAVLVAVIVIVLLLCAAIVVGLMKRHRKGTGVKKRKSKIARQTKRIPVQVSEREPYFRKFKKWKFILMPAKNPRIFLYKAAFLCRKSPMGLKAYESPRQFMNKLLSANMFDAALKEQLTMMADQIDRFYYSGAPQKSGYERRQGQQILRELRKRAKKAKHRNKGRR